MCPDPYLSHADSSFWAYSLRFYDDPKTQEACLDAQNRLGADVNLILYVFFKAQKGFRLNRNALQQANENVISWRTEVIHPLRQIRRKLKAHRYNLPENNQKTLRIEVKNLELKSEKFQQEYLDSLILEGHICEPKQAAWDNLSAYLNILGVDMSDPIVAILLRQFDALHNVTQSQTN